MNKKIQKHSSYLITTFQNFKDIKIKIKRSHTYFKTLKSRKNLLQFKGKILKILLLNRKIIKIKKM